MKAFTIFSKVYDFTGKTVKTLLDSEQAKGEHQFIFNASDLSAGVYFYQIKTGSVVETKKMILTEH